MKVFRNLVGSEASLKGCVLTIGNFDGVHLGHQALLSDLLDQAKKSKRPAVVMTFDPHPVQVLYPERSLQRLFTRADLVQQLEKLGIHALVVQAFSREFSQLSPEDFVQKCILSPLQPSHLSVGYDFSFGANRSGNLDMLAQMGQRFGFDVRVVEALRFEGEIVSSSRIRKALAESDVALARRLLGRPFYLEGIVEKGDQRGRQLGIPTANLKLISETCPQIGVYATRLRSGKKSYPSVSNVGRVPTFYQDWQAHPRVETHVLDAELDLYGSKVELEFVSFLREERKFASPQELVAQIHRDIAQARSALADSK